MGSPLGTTQTHCLGPETAKKGELEALPQKKRCSRRTTTHACFRWEPYHCPGGYKSMLWGGGVDKEAGKEGDVEGRGKKDGVSGRNDGGYTGKKWGLLGLYREG